MYRQKPDYKKIRFDLQIVASWVEPGVRVLDLGCGEGDLIWFLREYKGASCTGIERAPSKVARCIERGLTVLNGDINEEVLDYSDDAFDYVILSQTLQQVFKPTELIQSMLRVGSKVIVSFPNFSHIIIRSQLLFTGHAPVTKQLPFEWYNTPNIRVITLKDFKRFSKEVGFDILKMAAINNVNTKKSGKMVRFLPNLRATYGIFLIGKL